MAYELIINIIQAVLLTLLGLSTLYLFIFSLAGLFYRQAPYPRVKEYSRIAVLIPAYREDEVIIGVTREALAQEYPHDSYDVIIIADSFQPATIAELKKLPVKLVEVKFEKSTKSKALNKALESIGDNYEIAVVLDADNIMARDFLDKINLAFHSDNVAVQGHRMAKNLNTSLAVLDALSEEINNHIFRRGHRVLGFSSAVIGSAMGFRYSFFKDLMQTINTVGGFDKEIELKMLKARHKIAYLDDARVYDEKVQTSMDFSNQRRRWLSAQVHFFRRYFFDSVKELFRKGNLDYFDKTLQMIQLPRILLLGAIVIAGLLFTVFNILAEAHNWLLFSWPVLLAFCLISLIISVPRSYFTLSTLKAMASLPIGMLLMMRSLLRIRGANKEFIHTRHTMKENENK